MKSISVFLASTVLAVAIALISTAADAQQRVPRKIRKQLDEFFNAPITELEQRVDVVDDPLESTAQFSTYPLFELREGLFNIVWSDFFIRGHIDKLTDIRFFQIYGVIRQANDDWANPYQANFGSPLQTAEVKEIGNDVDCSWRDIMGSCLYEEHLIFDLPEAELRRIAEMPIPDGFSAPREIGPEGMGVAHWRFRIKNRTGRDVDHALFAAEARAILNVMDRHETIPTQ